MTVEEFYERINGDYNDALTRLPTQSFILRMLKLFATDSAYDELMEAVNNNDIKGSFEASHKLKGTAANLSFSQLYEALKDLNEQLRPQTEKADALLLQRVSDCYYNVIREINCLVDGESR